MLGDGVILLHDNIHTARKTEELLRNLEHLLPTHSPDSAPNLGSKHLSGGSFSSESVAKTVLEKLAQLTGLDFCHAGLNKLVRRSDKCLNRCDDYVEK
ncbi:hypothetical protein AVEN_97712-1 [Araneus ventricosus]|uniref:Uncharacterized protein n=1 Tax=Araneus ventricosus TaxID=182803 RepID=A0A4Y2W9J6_ARAVE|nr:hypothetical protein AVEN_97712-1 [Araneus ventricosus]